MQTIANTLIRFKHGSGIARSGTIDPDLFIMCNSGIGRTASDWMPSLSAIVHSPSPAVFTTFGDDELRRDVKLLKTMNAKFILEPGNLLILSHNYNIANSPHYNISNSE